MKRSTLQGYETIHAKAIFDHIERFGEGNHAGFSIYRIDDEDCLTRFRVDMLELGSFEVALKKGFEEFDLKNGDWIWIPQPYYRYTSCSSTFGGYPHLPIDKAFDALIKKL